jgi:hypothetical protein
MAGARLGSEVQYQGSSGVARWECRLVSDADAFKAFLKDVVGPRVADGATSFDADMRGLATTGMATKFVERLLLAVPPPKDWEIGEALAECALEQDSGHEVHWPWSTVLDRRTPRASLPGADLVGFRCDADSVVLLIGEVKTSSDPSTPPSVMYGKGAIVWQLEDSATRLDIQHSLLLWLHARCLTPLHKDLFQKAVGRYLESGGKALGLVGVLVRDTQPNQLDVISRAKALGAKLREPAQAEILAWYLPVAINEWPKLLAKAAP